MNAFGDWFWDRSYYVRSGPWWHPRVWWACVRWCIQQPLTFIGRQIDYLRGDQ